jgi:hypothetical protein
LIGLKGDDLIGSGTVGDKWVLHRKDDAILGNITKYGHIIYP